MSLVQRSSAAIFRAFFLPGKPIQLVRVPPLHYQPDMATLTRLFNNSPSLCSKVDLFDENQKLRAPTGKFTYFELFDVEKSFDLDAKALSKKFKSLQKQLHPDKFARASDQQKERSEAWSSLVNNGYNKLLKPLERGLYLLEVAGKPFREGEIATEPGFLANVMEINEEVDEADSIADLSGIGEANKSVLRDYKDKVSQAFKDNDVKKARELIAKMKYYSNIQDKIKEKELQFKMADL